MHLPVGACVLAGILQKRRDHLLELSGIAGNDDIPFDIARQIDGAFECDRFELQYQAVGHLAYIDGSA